MQEQAGFWLSPQQASLWVQEKHTRSVLLLDVTSASVESQIQDAVRATVARHEALRTVFRAVAGMKVPFQSVVAEPGFTWKVVADADVEAERTRGFDATNPPLVDATLIEGEDSRRLLMLSAPALLADATSLQLIAEGIFAELAKQPQAQSEQPQAQAELRYVQFAQWQRELLEPAGADVEDPQQAEAATHWKQVREEFAAPSLPEDSSQGQAHTALATLHFDPAALARMEEAARQLEASLELFLLAGWASLLRRLSGQSGFRIDCFFAGREYEELAALVGLVGRAVPVGVTFDESTSFPQLVRSLREQYRKAAEWQEYCPPEPVSGAGFEYAAIADPRILRAESHASRGLVTLSCRRTASGLAIELLFDASRLREETVKSWADYLQTLLLAATAGPQTQIAALPLLNEAQRHTLTRQWNQTQADYPRSKTFHQLFEEQAARTPDRVAVQCEGRQVTYAELNAGANQLAHSLREAGVTAGAPVGLCLERGEGTILALLGILKAGGAYVPLSAEHPKARLASQLKAASVLLTERAFLDRMPEFGGKVLCFGDIALRQGCSAENPSPVASSEDLAYVIYTSGSTGAPKGVGVRHRNVVNYATFIARLLNLENFPAGLHFGLVSTLSADLGNTCIFPALISGGCLHVIPQDMATDSERFAAYCRQNPLDVLKIVPSHLSALLDGRGAADLLPRRSLVLGGELLPIALTHRVAALAPACELINHYGPTETTVGSLTLRVKDFDAAVSAARSVPIGRPIANTRVYILDSCGEPVPSGVAGELFIAGDGVAAGYVGAPELTAERFVPEAFADDAERKMYRTGDLARYLPDGAIEFLGRADDQVKIRGFRIELSEIEAVAMRFAGVKRAVVLARPDERGDQKLIAWIVPQDKPVALDNLRAWLKASLPDYMMPAAFVPVAKLPLNANGKVDRAALPSPEESAKAQRLYAKPEGPIEEATAAIWADVLRLERVGAEDDFFEIGGHSLLATRIVSRLRENFRVPVTVRMVFERPTVRQLAEAIAVARLDADSADDDDEEILAGNWTRG